MDYSLGRLTHSETEEVKAHLLVCEECRTVLEEERELALEFSRLDQVAPANDVWALVRSRTRPRTGLLRVMQTRAARLATAFAAAATLAIMALSIQPQKTTTAVDPVSVKAVTVIMTNQQHDVTMDDPMGRNADALAAAIDEGT